MSKLSALIASIRREDEGQGLAEYALILALIAIIAIVALIFRLLALTTSMCRGVPP